MCGVFVSGMKNKHMNDDDDDDDDDDDFVEFKDSSQPMTSQLALVARQPSVAKQPVPTPAAAASHNFHATRHGQGSRPVIPHEFQLIIIVSFSHLSTCLCFSYVVTFQLTST